MSLCGVPDCLKVASVRWKSAKPNLTRCAFRGTPSRTSSTSSVVIAAGKRPSSVIRHLLSISTVAPVGHADALRAIGYGLTDFEDALQLSAAESCRCEVILTRNKADFGNPANIAVLTPEEFASQP